MPEAENPVVDNAPQHRFELTEKGLVAFATYHRHQGHISIPHVEAPPALQGTGAAGRLMEGIVQHARDERTKILPLCPYAAAWLQRHPEHRDIVLG